MTRERLTLLGVVVVALCASSLAFAWFASTGSGNGAASTGSLAASTLGATPGAGSVALSWSTVASPNGTGTVAYYVKRGGVAVGGTCGTAASPVTGTSCTDSGLTAGTYSYTVVARWRSWSAESSPATSATVASGVPTKLAITSTAVSGAASSTASLGALTVQRQDAAGNPVTAGGAVQVDLSSSSTGTKIFAATLNGTSVSSVTIGAGSSSATFYYGDTKAGTPTITAADHAAALTSATQGATISAASAASLVVSGYTSPSTAGVQRSLTVTAKDTFGNTATGYTGTVGFTSSDPQAVLPANTAFTLVNAGVRTFNATLKTVGTRSITATDTVSSSITGTQSSISITPAAAASLTVSGYPSPTTAGTSNTLTVTAKDAFGNTATGYTGTVAFTSTDGAATLPASTAFTVGDAGVKSFSATLKTAGSRSITATDTVTGTITGSQTGITVNPAAAVSLTVSGYPSSTTAGTSNAFTVTAKDTYGNTATGYTGTVAFSAANDAQAVLPANATFVSGDAGVKSFNATFKTVAGGTKTLTATDTVTGTITGSQTGIAVTAAAASTLTLAGPSSATAGSANALTLTATDTYGNTATGYTGDKSLTFSGAGTVGASTPTVTSKTGTAVAFGTATTVTFTAGVSSAGGSMVLYKAESASVSATDGALTTNSLAVTVSAASVSKLAFTTSAVTVTAGGASSSVMTVQRQDTYGNPITTGAITVTLSSTSSADSFRDTTDTSTITSVAISAGSSTASFRYRDTVAGTPTITVASAGLTSATQTATVNAAGAKTWSGGNSTWCTAGNWTPAGIPAATDNVTIPTANTVTIGTNCAAVANSVTVGQTANANAQTLTFTDATSTLTVGGDVAMSAPSGNATRTIAVGAGTMTVGGNLRLGVGANAVARGRVNRVTVSTGTVDVAGNLVYNDGNVASPNVAQNQVVFSGGGAFKLAGAFTVNNGGGTTAGTFTPSTSTFTYDGSGAQTIPIGVSSITYRNLKVANVAGATLSAAMSATNVTGDITIDAGATLNAGATLTHVFAGNFTNNGTFTANGSTMTFTGAAKTIGGTAATTDFGPIVIATGATITLNSDATATALTFNAAGTASSLTQGAGADLDVSGGVTLNQPTAAVTTAWNVNASVATVGGTISFAGTSTTTTRVAKIVVTTGTLNANGALTFAASAAATKVIDLSGGAASLNLGGALTAPAASSTLTAGTTSTFTYDGSSAQTISFFSAGAYANLAVSNTAGATLGAAITATNVTGDLTVSGGTLDTSTSGFAITGNAGKTLSVAAGATLKLSGGTGNVFPTGYGTVTLDAASTVEFAGSGAQNVPAGSASTGYGNLTVSGGSTKTATAAVNVNGAFAIAASTTFAAGTFTHTLEGSFTNGGTFTAGTSTIAFNGTSAQTIGGSATTFNNLTINNAAGVTLSSVDATVAANATGALTLTSGTLTTGANKVVVTSTSTTAVSRTSGYVVGNLQRAFAAGASTVVFDVGTGSTYAPISVAVAGANAGGALIGSTTAGQHASFGGSGWTMSTTAYVNRWWRLTTTGVAGTALTVTGYNATFTFANPGDLVGSPNTSALKVQRWTGSTWASPTSTSSTTTTVTGTTFGTAFGDFSSAQ